MQSSIQKIEGYIHMIEAETPQNQAITMTPPVRALSIAAKESFSAARPSCPVIGTGASPLAADRNALNSKK